MAAKQISTVRSWLLASPPAEWALNKLREVLIGAIKQGRVPRHVAFVMDGNRRYARSRRIETVEGHNLGFEALARILEVCYKSGVHTVTIYAFSIENFKRSKYEVDALMDMAKIKLTQLAQHGELLDRYGASIRILGQRSLIKEDVLEAMDRACRLTAHNTSTVLNVCFPYTSRDEITTAIKRTVSEYSRPISHPPTAQDRRSPFTEERIANTLKSQHKPAQDSQQPSAQQSQHKPAHESQQRPAQQSQHKPAHESQQRPAQQSQQRPAHESQQRLAHNSQQSPAHESQQRLAHNSQQSPAHESQQRPAHDSPQSMQPISPETLHSPSASSVSLSSALSSQFQSDTWPSQNGREGDVDTASIASSTTTRHPEVLSSTSSPPTSYASSPISKPHQTSKSSTAITHETPPQYKNPESIDSEVITSHLFTASDPPLDLLIRTSGVERLSDFMLWQCHQDTRIVFLNVLWPEFDLWSFLPVLWEWQWRSRKEDQALRMAMGQEQEVQATSMSPRLRPLKVE